MSGNPLLLDTDEAIASLLGELRRVAVLGIKTEQQRDQPAYYVAADLAARGVEIVPVPVYYPEAREILGRPVYRRLSEIPGPVDLVNVFRRPADLAAHFDDLRAKAPRAVWFQLGIRNDEVAQRLTEAGIAVVQDRCLMVEYRNRDQPGRSRA
ncbi:CoA-binding protein [Stagnimonas aquatica]|uniref:CoA-binding protein n=1 Tax=Stagnimonas aquatica TaxID=2689987 RepID=A0A3N0VGQ1_9GAMM|nr:CoA-binding protein [Stagnimonas aquatica]ROH91926.1 CoA-binding protein [Stagnimonas aquatica]